MFCNFPDRDSLGSQPSWLVHFHSFESAFGSYSCLNIIFKPNDNCSKYILLRDGIDNFIVTYTSNKESRIKIRTSLDKDVVSFTKIWFIDKKFNNYFAKAFILFSVHTTGVSESKIHILSTRTRVFFGGFPFSFSFVFIISVFIHCHSLSFVILIDFILTL